MITTTLDRLIDAFRAEFNLDPPELYLSREDCAELERLTGTSASYRNVPIICCQPNTKNTSTSPDTPDGKTT